jgi:ketol-acid reductoisomerase
VIERSDYPRSKLQQILGKDTMAVIGYGVQGRAQSQNMRDNGVWDGAIEASHRLRLVPF